MIVRCYKSNRLVKPYVDRQRRTNKWQPGQKYNYQDSKIDTGRVDGNH